MKGQTLKKAVKETDWLFMGLCFLLSVFGIDILPGLGIQTDSSSILLRL